ncbi:MAG: type III toxin-antitoxin system ToxN/AbiQ family toxin [Bacilli bacterium]|nr:type III toxin-antitoxin system ToxN/AbiQ family toxin [Bacilli bacterium]
MIFNLKIVKVNPNYCDYLRSFDNKVSYNNYGKELRPFIGILFKIDKCEYFAPLSSPKPKHLNMKNTIDFLKIKEGELGAVNFNNMIPVCSNNYELINLNGQPITSLEKKYQKLLKEQLAWLNENSIQIKNKSQKLYNLYKGNKLSNNIRKRCCDFILLEEKCIEYNSKIV